MKIRKIILNNNPILGDLILDFTNSNGKCVDTIILAGENGTGKTSILDLIFDFSKIGLDSIQRDEYRIIEVEISEDEQELVMNNTNSFKEGIKNGIVTFIFDFHIISNWNQVSVNFTSEDGIKKSFTGNIFHQPNIKPIFRAIYSDVEINYTSREITSVTAKDIDQKQPDSYKSSNNLATEITQLLIDIAAIDSQEFSQWGKENVGKPVDENRLDQRIKRFTKAFELIFPTKKFIGIENRNNHKEVIFEENGKRMSIDKLSSGEKQIVFRGGFLLKDKESSKGSVVLIDEPEISLHPSWQIEILDFYKNLFIDKGVLSSQLFIATHSPFIIHNSKRNNDKVIILTKKDGIVSVLETPEFYSWTNCKIVKEAFRINYDLINENAKLFVEGETDEKYLNKAKEIFELSLDFDISWIGRINENGNTEFSGDTSLNHAKSFFIANPGFINKKIILYYDSDTKKPEENKGNLMIRTMPRNESNELYKRGIENLLNLPETFDKLRFYSERIKISEYGAESIFRDLDKTKLCNWICDECSSEDQKKILGNLESILLDLNEEVREVSDNRIKLVIPVIKAIKVNGDPSLRS